MSRKTLRIIAGLIIAVNSTSAASAKTYQVTPEGNWFEVLSGDHLKPGDEVVLATGLYRDRRRLVIRHRGTAEHPIVIRAAEHGKAVLHRPDARQNSINVIGAQYLALRGLEITGGSSGIRLMKSDAHACKFVTIEGLHIHHIGGVAITANSPGSTYEGLVFRRNHIHHTAGHGEAFYLGVNNKPDGTTAGCMFNSLVEGNYIHDLKGPNVSQGDGIEIKDGSYNNIVRDNVIHDTNYPGVIVYGTDGKAPNVVERNVIWNSGDHGIQAAAEAIIRNNITFNNRGDGIHSHNHQSAVVGNLKILHNTVISNRPGGSAIRISPSDPGQLSGPVVIANNAIYAQEGGFAVRVPRLPATSPNLTIAGNVGMGATEGLPTKSVRSMFDQSGKLARDLDENYLPQRGSTLIGTATRKYLVEDDFDATQRAATQVVGARIFRPGEDRGWAISKGFKIVETE